MTTQKRFYSLHRETFSVTLSLVLRSRAQE